MNIYNMALPSHYTRRSSRDIECVKLQFFMSYSLVAYIQRQRTYHPPPTHTHTDIRFIYLFC